MTKKSIISSSKKKNSFVRIAMPLALIAAILLTTGIVFAATAEDIIRDVCDILFSIARYIGIILFAWGCISLALAFKNEDADSKSRSVLLVVVAIVLIVLKSLFWSIIDKII